MRKLLLAVLLTLSVPGFAQVIPNQPEAEAVGIANQRVMSPNELRVPLGMQSYAVQLPDGPLVNFDSITVRQNAGIKTVQGNFGNSALLLTTDGVHGFGYVIHGSTHYVIDTMGRQTTITESSSLRDAGVLIDGWGDDYEVNHKLILELSQRRRAASDVADDATSSVVDVAFFYDQSLADTEGLQSMRTRAQAAIDFTNAAVAAHGVPLTMNVVYVGPLSTILVGDPWNHFVANGDKWTIANDYGADLVHYLFPYRGEAYCGRAWLPGDVGVSGIGCNNPSETVAHEIGHNLGLHHDRANASNIGTPYAGYNYGYICGNAGTIMAYYNPRVPHYSSPLLQNNAENCGVDIGQPDAAFNGAVLDITRTDAELNRATMTTVGNVWIDTAGPIAADETSGTPIQITVMRDGDLNEVTSVEIGAIETDAVSGRDFTDFVERLEFGVGESSKQIGITMLDDEAYEPTPEVFEVVLRYPLNLAVTGSTVAVEITSDDPNRGIASFSSSGIGIWENWGTLEIPVNRTGPTDLELTVDVVLSDITAVAGVDYTDVSGPLTFAVGESSATINVPIIDDDLFEGETYKVFNVSLQGDNIDEVNASYNVFVWNEDLLRGEGGFFFNASYVMESDGTATVWVRRINGAESSYSFCVQDANTGTAVAGVDYEAGVNKCSSMTSGVTTASVNISIFDNVDADGEKYIDLTFFPYSNATIEPTTTRVYIIDDDAPTPNGGSIQFSAAEFVGTEESLSLEVTVSRVGGSAGVAIADFASSAVTATAGVDYTDIASEIVFGDGVATDIVINIPLIDDPDEEPEETFDLTLSNVGGATAGSILSATAKIAASDGPPPATALPIVIPLPDVNGDAIEDVAVLREGSILAEIRSGSNGALLRTIEFFPDFPATPITAAALPDADGNGVDELAVLASRDSDGRVVAEVRNLSGAQAPRYVWFAANHTPIDMTVIDSDADNNGVVELAVLSSRNSDGRGLVEVKNAFGPTNPRALWAGAGLTASHVAVIPDKDSNGVDEIAILSTRDSDGRIVAEIKNAAGTTLPTAVWFSAGHTAIDITAVDDKDSNGVPEVAVLSVRDSDGRNVVEIKNAAGPTAPSAVWFAAGHTATHVEQVRDADSNGVPEVAVLSVRDSDDRILVEVKNATGPTLPNALWYPPGHVARNLATIADTDGNGVDEALVLLIRATDGRLRVQGRNAAGSPLPKDYWFSP